MILTKMSKELAGTGDELGSLFLQSLILVFHIPHEHDFILSFLMLHIPEIPCYVIQTDLEVRTRFSISVVSIFASPKTSASEYHFSPSSQDIPFPVVRP